MTAAIDAASIEQLMNEELQKKEEEERRKSLSADVEMKDRDDDRDRDRRSGRGDRDSHRHGGRSSRSYRESNGGERTSEERERRRDGSRARSSKDANTGDEEVTRAGRDRSRDRGDRYGSYRGGGRRGTGGDYYSGGGRIRSRSPRRSPRRDERRRSPLGPRRADDRRVTRRRTATPEITEDDRDKRTIFVQQISARAETRHVRNFFEAVGEVVEAQIVKDRVNGRSKGVGYVEFRDEASVPKAIELTGKKLKGVPIIASLTEAEKNRAARTTGDGNATGGNSGAPFHRLYVGNIHFNVTETDLTEIFVPFGKLEMVQLMREDKEGSRSKGYGFVQFEDPTHAKEALSAMNGFELAGRSIRVGLGNDKFTPESTAHLLRNFPQQAASYQGSAFSGAGGRGAYAGGSGGMFSNAHGKDDRGVSGASALDDSDMSGVNFKQVDRAKLMANLARDEFPVPTSNKTNTAISRAPTVQQPLETKCIKIENAFDPDEELKNSGVDWAKDLEVDVKGECAKKYGEVVHIAVDPNSDGDIYIKFRNVEGGKKAMQGLNGRGFNYRTISATYVVPKIYNSLYAAAAKFD